MIPENREDGSAEICSFAVFCLIDQVPATLPIVSILCSYGPLFHYGMILETGGCGPANPADALPEAVWRRAPDRKRHENQRNAMDNPTAAMLVIGDEILSGRTRDANMHHLAGRLSDHGIDLCEARIIADCSGGIAAAVNELRAKADHLFTCGGIGPTHDDITADAVAAAFGVGIDVREDARALIAGRCEEYGLELNAARLRMARIPEGAELILNPVSAAPGFTIGNVHVMAGVPQIFSSMLDGLLDRIQGGFPLARATVEIESQEGELAAKLGGIAKRFPEVRIGSYPFRKRGGFGVNIVVRGKRAGEVAVAEGEIRKTFADCLAQQPRSRPASN